MQKITESGHSDLKCQSKITIAISRSENNLTKNSKMVRKGIELSGWLCGYVQDNQPNDLGSICVGCNVI